MVHPPHIHHHLWRSAVKWRSTETMNPAFLLMTFLSSSMDFLFTGIKQLDVQCFVASVLVMCCQYCWKCKCENKNERKDFKPKFSLWRQTIDILLLKDANICNCQLFHTDSVIHYYLLQIIIKLLFNYYWMFGLEQDTMIHKHRMFVRNNDDQLMCSDT